MLRVHSAEHVARDVVVARITVHVMGRAMRGRDERVRGTWTAARRRVRRDMEEEGRERGDEGELTRGETGRGGATA